jgi:hypothetical protein
MKSLRAVSIGAALALFVPMALGAAPATATAPATAIAPAMAAAPDPVVGSWILNVGKSKFGSQPVLTNQVRTYTETPDGLEVIVKGESVAGESDVFESTFKYDGKDYPATGVPEFDTVAVRRISPLVVHGVLKREGKIVGHLTRIESKDGLTLTLTEHVRGPKGELLNEVLVYDKQT